MPDTFGNTLRLVRRKGVCMPEGARWVGRPTIFGNPFQVPRIGHLAGVLMHREWLNCNLGALFLQRRGFDPGEIDALNRRRGGVLTSLHRLHGLDLVCWCALTAPCDADTLLRLVPLYADYESLAA